MAALTFYSNQHALANDNTIIGAPGAGFRTVIVFLGAQNDTTTADRYIWYEGVSAGGTKIATVLAQNQGDGAVLNTVFEGSAGEALPLKLGENKALTLNKSQAVACNVSVWYYTERI
jgi:hypothetical protein